MVGFRPIVIALLLALAFPAAAAANPATQIIVKSDAGLTAAERADIRSDAQVRLVDLLPIARTELVAGRPGDVKDALRDLKRDPDVQWAQLNHRRHALALPNDAAFRRLWGLRNVAQLLFPAEPYSWGLYDADSDVPEAWDQGVSGANVDVAVVDSGITVHEDIDAAARIVEKRNFVAGEPAYATEDGDGHGTHVTGTIVAKRNNGLGVAGIAPAANVTVLRVLDNEGLGWDADIALALDYAGERGIPIVNVSLGGPDVAPAIEAAINENPGTLYVIAAGNDGRDNDAKHTYPCDLGADNIICVGASTNRDALAHFSNYSDVSVDLFAPGDDIVSTYPNNEYWFLSGTSTAAPHVAATAALVLQAVPGLGTDALKNLLLDSVDARPAFAGKSVSGGRLNAGLAVATALADSTDTDGDDVIDAVDECDMNAQPGKPAGCPEPHTDGDGVADWYDNCDSIDNAGQSDLNRDGEGDACDDDIDGDSRVNTSDNCPTVTNSTQRDYPDGDGIGDVCDPDRDNDGVANGSDICPTEQAPGTSNGCFPRTSAPPSPADSDGDGRADASDACPGEYAFSNDGCPLAQVASVSATARKRGTRRSATVKVRATRPATLRLIVERRKGRRWVRVERHTVAGTGATLRLSRLKRGSHRVRVSISSSAGRGTSVTKSFRVR